MSSSISETAEVRLSLPSQGRLAEDTINFLNACGLKIDKPNPRQYEARIPDLPEVLVLFQRPADIVVSVRDGSVDLGISGLDVIEERKGQTNQVLILHDSLNFGHCYLNLAVPETWSNVHDVPSLAHYVASTGKAIRVATKYPVLTGRFLDSHQIPHILISAEGTLETAPAIGYADMISDLVSSGQTLRDNRLRALPDGLVLRSQSVLIANRTVLKKNAQALRIARYLIEYFDAHLRASENVAIFANMRGDSYESVANCIFEHTSVSGLQGPTISRVIVRKQEINWYAINIIVKRNELFKTINELRSIGGSGVVVLPVTYIFEEEPPRYLAMLRALEGSDS
jgi:ATP phosphoribosyltransferase